MPRFVSFTFDDGLVRSCRKAAAILEGAGFRATFLIVSSWVGDRTLYYVDRMNRGLDHGRWEDWREMSRKGHEIGSHSHRHFNARGLVGNWAPWLLRRDYRRSREVIGREVGSAPDTITMPHNARSPASDEACTSLFRRVIEGKGTVSVNAPGETGPIVKAWAPGAGVAPETMLGEVRSLKPGEWLVFQFHGLDGEAYEPIATEAFEKVVRGCADTEGLRVVTVRQGPDGASS